MVDSDGTGDNPITLLNIKDNLKDYSLTKQRSLTSVLINTLNNLDKDKKIKDAMENMRKR